MRTLLLVAVAALPTTARADVTRCSTGSAPVAFSEEDIPTQSGDTGWFPGGSPAQLRLTGEIVGKTAVKMDLGPTACWDGAMALTTPGVAKTGTLDVEYGAQLQLFAQIHTSILGESIDWSGQIPIPYIPTDLLLAGSAAFNPVMLPDSKIASVSVSDTTSSIPVISTTSLSSLIGISGISGGLSVTVTGEMTSTYTSQAISLGDATITSATGSAAIEAPAAGYGANLAVTAGAIGNVHYVPALVFAANFNVTILGFKIVNWQLASITMPLTEIDRPVMLAGAPTQIGLPHLDTVPQQLGFASGGSQELQLHNSGGAPLMLELASGPSGVSANPVTIAPGSDGIVDVIADPTMVAGDLVLTTNDPNHPTISIALDASSSGQMNGGSGSDDSGDPSSLGGCNVGGGSGGGAGLFLLGVGLLVMRRRRMLRA